MFKAIERRQAENVIAKLLKPLHSPHVKSDGTVMCCVSGPAIEICCARPAHDDPDEIIEIPVVKFRYVRKRQIRQLFSLRDNGNGPMLEADGLSKLVEEVWHEPFCCFWG